MPFFERAAAILAIIIVFVGVGWYVATREPIVETSAFFAEGNLVKDNPGLVSGVWHLVYEEPGFPGLSIPLSFDEASVCTAAGSFLALRPKLT